MKNEEQRIWNKSELEAHPDWRENSLDNWYNNSTDTWIVQSILGQPLQWCKDNGYIVTPEMIAKEYSIGFPYDKKEIEEITKPQTAIAANGTELVVGGRYRLEWWKKDEFNQILFIGEESIFIRDQEACEYCCLINNNWLPYEPKEEPKPLEGYQKFYIHNTAEEKIGVMFSPKKPESVARLFVAYTEQEAVEAGLKI